MNVRQSVAAVARRELRDISEENDLEITIARDKVVQRTPGANSDVSDAKTSDITRVDHGKDLSGIRHEKAPSVSAS